MVVNRKTVVDVYKSLLNGNLSYQGADRWAWEMMEHCDNGNLTFEPREDEEMLWDLIQYLYGIDTPSMADRTKPARSSIDIEEFLAEKGITF